PRPRVGRRARQRDATTSRVEEVLDLVEATDYAARPIGQVSGGEQQRLLIAQALVRQPKMLLLDEPLDSLDLPNQAAVAALVARVASNGVTVLMVAHDVNPILGYLDRVVYLGPGGAVAGQPGAVMTADRRSPGTRWPSWDFPARRARCGSASARRGATSGSAPRPPCSSPRCRTGRAPAGARSRRASA